jgi:hypothetical protein
MKMKKMTQLEVGIAAVLMFVGATAMAVKKLWGTSEWGGPELVVFAVIIGLSIIIERSMRRR